PALLLLPPVRHLHHPPLSAIYTLSLHDALPISTPLATTQRARRFAGPSFVTTALTESTGSSGCSASPRPAGADTTASRTPRRPRDRKSTRLNSSHQIISYAVFCLKKKQRLLTYA